MTEMRVHVAATIGINGSAVLDLSWWRGPATRISGRADLERITPGFANGGRIYRTRVGGILPINGHWEITF